VRFINIKFAFDSPVRSIGIENLNCFTVYHNCVDFSVLYGDINPATATATPEESTIHYETEQEFHDRVDQVN